MVHKCDYCGEEKLCMFDECTNSIISNLGLCFKNRWGEFICEDCDNYLKHQEKILLKKAREDKEKKTKEFIKERDKFLHKIK